MHIESLKLTVPCFCNLTFSVHMYIEYYLRRHLVIYMYMYMYVPVFVMY